MNLWKILGRMNIIEEDVSKSTDGLSKGIVRKFSEGIVEEFLKKNPF